MKKDKLTTLERRAHAACDEIRRYAANGDAFHFVAYWKRSAMWGLSPSIAFYGDKAAHASGCGYDKLSAVVAEFLSPLVPGVNLGHGQVSATSSNSAAPTVGTCVTTTAARLRTPLASAEYEHLRHGLPTHAGST